MGCLLGQSLGKGCDFTATAILYVHTYLVELLQATELGPMI